MWGALHRGKHDVAHARMTCMVERVGLAEATILATSTRTPRLLVVAGSSGVGKSSTARRILLERDFTRCVSTDAIREVLRTTDAHCEHVAAQRASCECDSEEKMSEVVSSLSEDSEGASAGCSWPSAMSELCDGPSGPRTGGGRAHPGLHCEEGTPGTGPGVMPGVTTPRAVGRRRDNRGVNCVLLCLPTRHPLVGGTIPRTLHFRAASHKIDSPAWFRARYMLYLSDIWRAF